MDDRLTAWIVEQLGELRPRNQIIQDLCVRGNVKWPEAEQLLAQVEHDQSHAVVRRQGPWLIAMSVVMILLGMLPYAFAFYFIGAVSGWIPGPSPGPASDVEVSISIPIPLSTSGLAEELGTCIASFGLLGGGIVGLYETLRRYRET